jgi:hypothetical protein
LLRQGSDPRRNTPTSGAAHHPDEVGRDVDGAFALRPSLE